MIPILITSRTADLDPRVREAIAALDQPVVHHVCERAAWNPVPMKNFCVNVAMGRTEALKGAFEQYPEAQHFLFLDSDIVPPQDTIERFFDDGEDKQDVIGAWWRYRSDRPGYAAGMIDSGDKLFVLGAVLQPRLTMVTYLTLGCTLVPRRFVQQPNGEPHTFDPGIDRILTDQHGKVSCLGDSGAFSEHVTRQGGHLLMDSNVIAEHLL